MEGLTAQQLIDLMKLENGNFEFVLSDEPYLNDALLYLSMALAYDCMDWEEPAKAKEGNLLVLEPAVRYAGLFKEQWFPEPRILVFGQETERTEDERLAMLEKARNLRLMILNRHLDAFGRDTQENVTHAYRETNTALIYMIAAGCARSTDLEGSLAYARKSFSETVDYLMSKRA